MDHVVPLRRGCKTFNNQKRELLPLEWEDYLERLRQESSP